MVKEPPQNGASRRAGNQTFGRLLHQALIAKGWTQAQLANELHVHPTTVSQWRKGHRPDPELATKIEELLGCDPGSLRGPLENEIREHDRRTATGRLRFWTDATCPYRGLFAFREEDSAFFHGREGITDKLVEAVRQHPLVGVIGSSGSGKSSLVFAGLLPRLQKEGGWRILSLRPGSHPLRALAAAFVSLREPALHQTDTKLESNKLAEAFGREELCLQDMTVATERLLVVVDQFEELLTPEATAEESRRFIDVLTRTGSAAGQQDTMSLRVVITVRADFLGQALSHRLLRDALQQASVMVGPMTRQELRDAIEKPACSLRVTIEEGLVDRILDVLGDEPGQLPLLEFALARLWEGRQCGLITHEAYDAMGGVEQALSGFAEEVYGALCEKHRQRAARVFLQLVRPGAGTDDTRRVATREEIGEEDWNLVTCLASSRLVVTSRQEGTGKETIELAHEALITHWKSLRTWLEADRRFRLWQERLRSVLHEWNASSHDDGALLRGGPLAEATSWKTSRGSDLSPAEARFIDASISAAEEIEREKEAARRRDLTGAQRRTRLRAMTAILVVLLLVAGLQTNNLRRERNLAMARNDIFSATVTRDQQPLSLLLLLDSLRITFTNEALTQLQQGLLDPRHNRLALGGHNGPISGVASSPDGRTIASASDDKTVRLWDVHTRRPVGRPLVGHKRAVRDVTFSPDGRTLASASDDRTVRLWEIATGEPIGEPPTAHTREVNSVAFSPDGRILASASADGTVRLWDVARGRTIGEPLIGNIAQVNDVAFSPDGTKVASAGADRTVRLWDAATGKPIGEPLTGHASFVNGVAFSPDGKTIASAGADYTVRLWDVVGHKPIGEPLIGHETFVNNVAFSPDGMTIASAGADYTVRLWDATTMKQIGEPLMGPKRAVEDVVFSRDGAVIASVGADEMVWLWDATTRTPVGAPLGGLSPDHRTREVFINSVAVSPDGTMIASAGIDKSVRLQKAATGKLIGEPLNGHTEDVNSVAFSPDGTMIASASNDHTVRLWDVATGRPIGEPLPAHIRAVNSVAFSPDGTMMATGSRDKTVVLWNVASRTPIGKPLRGHTGSVNSVAFSPDGTMIASGSTDRSIRLWDVADRRPIGKALKKHTDVVNSVAFSPDGRTVASGSSDHTVQLWDVASRKPAGEPLKGHTDLVSAVAFSPDGKTVASVSSDHTVQLWDVDSRQPIGEGLTGHTDWVGAVAFSPDGRWVASAGSDKTVRLWPGSVQAWADRACMEAGRNLTREEWRTNITGRSYQQTCPQFPSGGGVDADAARHD